MGNGISRRKVITTSLKATLGAFGGYAFGPKDLEGSNATKAVVKKQLPFRISLNTSTISAYGLGVDQQIEMVSAAGFEGIELWMRDITSYLEKGGTLESLKGRLKAGQLVLENIIGFSQWCHDDPEERKKAIEQLRSEMQITAALGGSFIAAPVMGVKSLDCTKFDEYAERYAAILDLKAETSVTPVLELWGAGALHKLADCAQIVIRTGHPAAAVLLDFYHLYRGGNDWDTVDCLNGKRLPVIHINDFPATPARESLTDAHRILPGDGICPFDQVLPKLYDSGFRGGLSVELFNREYWATMDAETMLKNSYVKTVQVVERAMATGS